ncbi:MAG: sugar ABC transporter permease [Clostridia bacterium]|nr:sugar ABC transporter permease [Clostridia bacterium]
MKHTRKQRLRHSDRSLILLSLPTLLWYLCFCYLPLFGIVMAFKKYRLSPGKSFLYSLFVGSSWVGTDNFRYLFMNPQIGQIIRNTVLYNLVFLVLGLVIPVALAIALSYVRSERLRSAAQTLSMLPHFLSWMIVSYFVYAFLATDKGLINSLLQALGKGPVSWYQEPGAWPWLLTLIHEWKAFGYSMVLYYSYILGIDPALYESAAIDGARPLQMIRYITLPQLKGIIIMMGLLSLGGIFNSDFGLFYQVPRDSGALVKATQTVDVYIYKALMEQTNYGFSAAASLLQNGLGCLLLLLANLAVRRIDPEAGL